jgi:hypothetical protein
MTDLNAQAQADQPAEPDNERIITSAMIREQDQERIAQLEGLLREAHETLSSGLESDSELEHEWSKADRELCERIAAALKEE